MLDLLQACSGVFGIKDTDLFQPSMLYDYSDFARVLHTLSRLSNSPKARARISGFPGQAEASTSHDEDQVIALELGDMFSLAREEAFLLHTQQPWVQILAPPRFFLFNA